MHVPSAILMFIPSYFSKRKYAQSPLASPTKPPASPLRSSSIEEREGESSEREEAEGECYVRSSSTENSPHSVRKRRGKYSQNRAFQASTSKSPSYYRLKSDHRQDRQSDRRTPEDSMLPTPRMYLGDDNDFPPQSDHSDSDAEINR